jgi:hypothetical protein
MRAFARNALKEVTRRRPRIMEDPFSTRTSIAFTTSIAAPSAIAAIATTASFCTTACEGHDLSFFERKKLDWRLFMLEGMLRDPTPNLPQMCETISDLTRTPYARVPRCFAILHRISSRCHLPQQTHLPQLERQC